MARTYPSTGSQPPSVELIVRQGPQPGQRFSLTRPTIIIGREVGNDVVVSDPQISRRHASLTWDGRQFIIQDLGSANGTFVNGVRLTAPQVLQPGDAIGLGPTVLLGFQALPVAPAYAPPRPEPVEGPRPAAPPPPALPPPAYAPRPPARRRGRFLIPLTALLGLCFVLAVAAALGYFFLWPRPEARPLVLIRSPRHGEQVEVGQEVTVHSIARDEGKVVRVELWVDGQLQETQASNLPGGTSPFPLLARWQPPSPGTHTLIARAFNARGGRGHASINVEAIELADRDDDGVADEADACPDEPGSAAADGCPDQDRDGISDAEDACPDEAGLPEGGGCPAPGEGNRDGDGLLDYADACPDEPGSPRAAGCPDADGDGIADAEDACPTESGWPERDGCPTSGDLDGDGIPATEDACLEEWGLPEHAGCPDDDGDGVRDVDDACLDEPGLPEHAGCPDRDRDGVRDRDDACPDVPGAGPSGCPDTGVGDRDRDGLADDVDLCPDEFGPPEHIGCPAPGEGEDADGDDIADDEELPAGPLRLFGLAPLWPFLPQPEPIPTILTTIEVEALSFAVNRDYDGVYCYVSLGPEPQTRVPPEPDYFDPAGEREWHFEFEDGENRRVLVWDTDWPPLTVDMECWAYIGEDPPFSLGELHEEHPEEDWNSDEIHRRSSGPFVEHWFEVTYRICRPLCLRPGEEAPWDLELPQPIITHAVIGGSIGLVWQWEGDPASIEEFRVYSQCGGAPGPIFRTPPDEPYISINSLEPDCSGRCEFHVTAYGYGRESPPSNTWVWEGEECPRTVRVHFLSLQTGHLGDDEWWADNVGPIFGHFRVSGMRYGRIELGEERLEFNGVDYPNWWGERIRGYRLDHGREYSIQDIFDRIGDWMIGCMGDCPGYHAPADNYIDVELGPDDDLTFGGSIWDADTSNPSDTLFEADYTLSADEIPVPGGGGERTILDRNIELRVWIMGLHR
ncbi:MAG: FHA domain-containing protein [Anaerolineae bacterium]